MVAQYPIDCVSHEPEILRRHLDWCINIHCQPISMKRIRVLFPDEARHPTVKPEAGENRSRYNDGPNRYGLDSFVYDIRPELNVC